MPNTTDHESFVAAFHDHFTSDPNERIMKGVARDLGELPDPSLAANERRPPSVTDVIALEAAGDDLLLGWRDATGSESYSVTRRSGAKINPASRVS